jgi:hypothetical protein
MEPAEKLNGKKGAGGGNKTREWLIRPELLQRLEDGLSELIFWGVAYDEALAAAAILRASGRYSGFHDHHAGSAFESIEQAVSESTTGLARAYEEILGASERLRNELHHVDHMRFCDHRFLAAAARENGIIETFCVFGDEAAIPRAEREALAFHALTVSSLLKRVNDEVREKG